MGFFGSPTRRKSTPAGRLRRKEAMLKKLQKKFNSPKAKKKREFATKMASLDKQIETLRAKF